MKKIIFLLIIVECCLMISCSTSITSEMFFGTTSTKYIPNISMDTLLYRTRYVDSHCISCGSISEPVYNLDIKYDTMSRYRVVIEGKIVFEERSSNDKFKSIDSIGITRMIVYKSQSQKEFYTNCTDCNNSIQYKEWKECTIPQKILKVLRKDFLLRMKCTRYSFKDVDATRISVSHTYRLY